MRRSAFALAFLCLFTTGAVLAATEPQPSAGVLLFAPDRHEGWKILAITQKLDGRIEVYCNPALIWQDGEMSGLSYNGHWLVHLRFVEVVVNQAPNEAAVRRGWRDPYRALMYTAPVYDKTVTVDGVPHRVVVRSDGENFGVYIMTLERIAVVRNSERPRLTGEETQEPNGVRPADHQ
jgi:hypothetical protein